MQIKKEKKIINDPNSPWMTLPEAAAHYHLGLKAIRNWIYAGLVNCYKPGKICFVNREEMDTLMKDSEMGIPTRRARA